MAKKIDRQRAILNLRQEAEKRVIKDEVMKFRLESSVLQRLLRASKQLNKPVGALVREWVVERLTQIENQNYQSPEVTSISIIATTLAEHGLLPDKQVSQIQKLLAPKR